MKIQKVATNIKMANKYIQPICDCGSILKVHESHGIEYFYKISNQGKETKIPIKDDTSDRLECTNLTCSNCGAIYEINWDRRERIIRGSLID